MDFRICPICGFSDADHLQQHLLSHSKESLVDVLLHHQSQSIANEEVVISSDSPSTSRNDRNLYHHHMDASETTVSITQECEDVKPLDQSTVAEFEIEIPSSSGRITPSNMSLPVYSFSLPDAHTSKKNLVMPTLVINRNPAPHSEKFGSSSSYCSTSRFASEQVRNWLLLFLLIQ